MTEAAHVTLEEHQRLHFRVSVFDRTFIVFRLRNLPTLMSCFELAHQPIRHRLQSAHQIALLRLRSQLNRRNPLYLELVMCPAASSLARRL